MQADFAALDLNRSYSARSSDDSLRGEDAASSIGAGWIPAEQAGTSAPSAKTCAGPVTAGHEDSCNQAVDVGAPDVIFSTGVAVGDKGLAGTFGTFSVDSRGLLMWPRPGCPSAGHRPGKRPDPESDSDSDSDGSEAQRPLRRPAHKARSIWTSAGCQAAPGLGSGQTTEPRV